MEKLKVTLEDRPIDIELAQYKRMFEAACSALGAVSHALGCDPDEGGAEPLLAAIEELKAHPQPKREPLTLSELAKIFASIPSVPFDGEWQLELVRAIEVAHGIKGEA